MKFRAFLQLHASVFLFGFTAILGDMIQMSTLPLVWWRVFLTIFFLVFILKPFSILKNIKRKFAIRHIIVGILVAVHWLAFYGSIKVANASIALIAMSTTSFVTAIVEPLMIGTYKWKRLDLIISLLVIPAMVLIYYNADEVQQLGLWIGLFAATVGAIFSVFNKMWLEDKKEYEIIFIQQGTVWIFLSVLGVFFLFFGVDQFAMPKGIDWLYLIVFAIACTIIPYFLYLRSMKWLSAFDVSFAFNMEPVYGLLMAAMILKDHQELSFKIYVGMLLIFAMVFVQTLMKGGKLKRILKV